MSDCKNLTGVWVRSGKGFYTLFRTVRVHEFSLDEMWLGTTFWLIIRLQRLTSRAIPLGRKRSIWPTQLLFKRESSHEKKEPQTKSKLYSLSSAGTRNPGTHACNFAHSPVCITYEICNHPYSPFRSAYRLFRTIIVFQRICPCVCPAIAMKQKCFVR